MIQQDYEAFDIHTYISNHQSTYTKVRDNLRITKKVKRNITIHNGDNSQKQDKIQIDYILYITTKPIREDKKTRVFLPRKFYIILLIFSLKLYITLIKIRPTQKNTQPNTSIRLLS